MSSGPVDEIFVACNAAVVPACLLLVAAPDWIWTRRLVHSMLYPLRLGAVYAIGFATRGRAPEGGGLLLYGTLRIALRRETSLEERPA
jgi:hypothetical protein